MDPVEVDEHLARLNQAREIVKGEHSFFPQIVKEILSVANYPDTRLKKWMANFLWLGFSNEKFDYLQKMELSIACLDTICLLLEEKDTHIRKGIIDCICCIYPLLFLHLCKSPNDEKTLAAVKRIKSNILPDLKHKLHSIRICCIKFASIVVLTQSPGLRDPRLVKKDDISSLKIPPHHPSLKSNDLEKEAMEILQSLLSAFDGNTSDPLYISAVLNTLPILVKRRQALLAPVMDVVLKFNVPKLTDPSVSPQQLQLSKKCIEKSVRVTLIHLIRNGCAGPYTNKIHAYLAGQLMTGKGDEKARKRPHGEVESSLSKRTRSDVVHNIMGHMPSGPAVSTRAADTANPLVSIFASQASNNPLHNFDVTSVPVEIASEIVLASLTQVDPAMLKRQLYMLRERVNSLTSGTATAADVEDDEDEDDYEPPEVDVNSINDSVVRQANRMEGTSAMAKSEDSFKLETPDKLPPMALLESFYTAFSRLFSYCPLFEKSIISNSALQLNTLERVNNAVWDKHHWSLIIPRLCTRGLSNFQPIPEQENTSESQFTLSSFVRGQLYNFIISNWRTTTELSLNWLCEEWLNDARMNEIPQEPNSTLVWEGPQYEKWALKLIDAILPYLESRDKVFMIFMSELPELTPNIVQRIRQVCLDPDKVKLGFMTLQYLITFRPPSRDLCLELVESLWKENGELRAYASKLLKRWRPSFLEQQKKEEAQAANASTNQASDRVSTTS
ncbi:mRNA cleavage and polyadenylation specificity factor complex subunit Pta1 [Schizosaccharomyces japonicus yFS275]|uniref:mRNA cleavage and polyadenylation specificity factor complex subunit Pta1 n=1 Tax=Schizosaccharomyces japonicus (strain yFS275 / FY16936) TaxID=402676 RepID=B6K1D9_SCHJY|nr:mRNA cleavage and polyadenylation specificity factor complex subunit Pta1 [Schizosaccharomyces japonicus yFS275]EEB07760.2 mRNA cleavage and polyadenylation specificity factor complex subunit Pta1 [Schizosaccharomyces japonicus yFS275]